MNRHRRVWVMLGCCLLSLLAVAQPINRKAVVSRHNVQVSSFDSLQSLTVGNGAFAFTVDATGLQTFPQLYQKGVPLGTQSEWGWHSFSNEKQYRFEESLREYNLHGRKVSYGVQIKEPLRNKQAGDFFRQNPHRLHLGHLGFELIKKDGSIATSADLRNIKQTLHLWTGIIHSSFELEGIPVYVQTMSHQEKDAIAVQVTSSLIKEKRLRFILSFPYPTGEWADGGAVYQHNDKHRSELIQSSNQQAVWQHQLDTTRYFAQAAFAGNAIVSNTQPHHFAITPSAGASFAMSLEFAEKRTLKVANFQQVQSSSTNGWLAFWQSGGAVDFGNSKDPRAFEIERRVVLSQYLTKVQCAGNFPPQETGLTYNSWFGKPHLEMHWWHGVHFALWGRHELLEKSMQWYRTVYDEAKAIAVRQGYEGVRWQKMVDHAGNESPSSVGAFLIWQQPHFITFAELLYKSKNDKAVLKRYSDLVFATADFMASYAWYDSSKGRYILGPGLIPAQERFEAVQTFNPTYELHYWHWALTTAQAWRVRLGLPRHTKWDDVLHKLSPLPVQDSIYLATESAPDSYTNPRYLTDHPAVYGTLGMLPASSMLNKETMRRTFNHVWNVWTWDDTWGWDFPMAAMTATRLNMPDKAVDALLMPIRTNRYLPNGHNYQDERLRLYLPGNGGVLTAVALMLAGFEGNTETQPGIPKNADWQVKWEGLQPFF